MGRTKAEAPPATPTAAPPEADEAKQTATEGQVAAAPEITETPETPTVAPEGSETPATTASTLPETPEPEKEDTPAPDKRITFTLTGAGSFTGFGLARILKDGTVDVDEETAQDLRRTGLFEEG